MSPTPKTDDWSVRRHAIRSGPIGLPPTELADYGLGPAEVRRLALMSSEKIERRNRMAQLNGLDPARLEEDRALDIATALCCADCAAEGRCRVAVEDGVLPDGAGFCANAATYRTLAAE